MDINDILIVFSELYQQPLHETYVAAGVNLHPINIQSRSFNLFNLLVLQA